MTTDHHSIRDSDVDMGAGRRASDISITRSQENAPVLVPNHLLIILMNDSMTGIYLSLLALAVLASGQQGASPKIDPSWGR